MIESYFIYEKFKKTEVYPSTRSNHASLSHESKFENKFSEEDLKPQEDSEILSGDPSSINFQGISIFDSDQM
jgi:hypothetical protein